MWSWMDACTLIPCTAENRPWGKVKFGLSYCRFLRTIRFDFNSEFNPTMIGPLADTSLMRCIFKELFADNRKGLTIIFHLPTAYPYDKALNELDKYAVTYARQGFSKLVILNDGRCLDVEARKLIRGLMPKLRKKGILQFE